MKKIILAEQHKTMRLTLQDLILSRAQELGIDATVDAVEDPQELVRKVLADSYDLAITYQGVEGQGFKACKQIRAENPVIPVYICSVFNYAPEQLANNGATGYIPKDGSDIERPINQMLVMHLELGKTHQDMQR